MTKSKKSNEAPSASILTSLSRSEINEILEVALATPMEGHPGQKEDGEENSVLWGIPILIEGEPGIAKTARIKQLARHIRVKARSLFAAQHPPEDFSGALIPDGNGSARQVCALAQIREFVASGPDTPGIIFLDEINGAPPATQGAVQSFIHERVAGDDPLPNRIRIVAAQNPVEIATGGHQLAPGVANRFMHLTDPGPTPGEWTAYLIGSVKHNVQPSLDAIERAVVDEWPNMYPEVTGLFSGFMERNPSLMHQRPNITDPRCGKAWPSARTWDYALRLTTVARIMDKSETIRDALIESCVGEGAATMFSEYRRKTDIPKPLDVLKGNWKIDADRLDIVLAAFSGAIAYVRQRPSREEKMKLAPLAWGCLSNLLEQSLSDIVVVGVEALVQERLGINSGDAELKAAASKVLVPLSKTGVGKYLEERA